MIKTEGLTKVYDGHKAVESLSIEVGNGHVFGFLGPNGAGKTTTIGMMVGLIEPTSGRCMINDIEVTRNPREAKRLTGYLPDGVGFYTHMSAEQNLKYFSRFYHMGEADAEKRITSLLEYVGLGGVTKAVGGYSRGMRQRLGLAQALLNDPEIVFMDEPTNGLDPQGVIQFRNIIKDLSKQGKTVFFSSHILEEVQQVCDTVGIISMGKMVACGPLDDVKASLQRGENVTIIVKTGSQMPELSDPRIVNAVYSNGSAIIKASEDIRPHISEELFRRGIRVHELRLEERSLESIFLDTVYGGA